MTREPATAYRPEDRSMLGDPPWKPDDPALIAWEEAHGHDVRLDCDVYTPCHIEIADLRQRAEAAAPQPAEVVAILAARGGEAPEGWHYAAFYGRHSLLHRDHDGECEVAIQDSLTNQPAASQPAEAVALLRAGIAVLMDVPLTEVDGWARRMVESDQRTVRPRLSPEEARAALASQAAPLPGGTGQQPAAEGLDVEDAALPWHRETVGHLSTAGIAAKISADLDVPLDEGLPPNTDATWIVNADNKVVAFVGNGRRQTRNADLIIAAVARLAKPTEDGA